LPRHQATHGPGGPRRRASARVQGRGDEGARFGTRAGCGQRHPRGQSKPETSVQRPSGPGDSTSKPAHRGRHGSNGEPARMNPPPPRAGFKNPRAHFNFQGRTCSISGVGSYVPARVVTNADLEKIVDTTDEWITTRTGIKERRMAAANEYTSDMATQAAL